MNLRFKEYIVAGFAFAVVLIALVFAFNGAAAASSFEQEEKNARPAAPAEAFPQSAQPENEFRGASDGGDEMFASGGLYLFEPESSPASPASAVPAPEEKSSVPADGNRPQAKLAAVPAKAPRPAMKKFSCVGQICIDAETGETLSSRNADVAHPPASVTKLMTIFLVLDAADAGTLRLSSPVVASRRAQEMGGTQVHLAEGEVNSVEDLLYALMLQSANDAAVALAEKVSGSVEEFVAQMNRKARELGLTNTKFSTPHGLPMSKKELAAGKRPDMSSAADLAKLSRALILAHPEVFRYASARTKVFRQDRLGAEPFPMSNHNKLLWLFPGCDGLKTGWTNAGASIVTTASRGNRRVIAVVLGGLVPGAQKGSVDPKASQQERNQRAAELMFDGLKKLDALKYEPTPQIP